MFAEREEIALTRARGETMRAIARRLGRAPSMIARELRRHADGCGYRATTAHALAYGRASHPKPAKLATNLALRQVVQVRRRFSPEQIAGRLRRRFPDDPEMWVSTCQAIASRPIRIGAVFGDRDDLLHPDRCTLRKPMTAEVLVHGGPRTEANGRRSAGMTNLAVRARARM